MKFAIRTNSFEGPLELLLNLIEKRKLHIGDVSMAAVTDDFLSYLKKFPETQKDEMADFVLIASTLLLIKSIALVPHGKMSKEEISDIDNLEERLKKYARIKEVAKRIAEMFGHGGMPRSRSGHAAIKKSPFVLQIKNTENFLSLICKAAKIVSARSEIYQNERRLPQATIKKKPPIEDAIIKILKLVEQRLNFKFSEISNKEKETVIVNFLALLELIKRGAINAREEIRSKEIHIESSSCSVPKYA